MQRFYETKRPEGMSEGFESNYETWESPDRMQILFLFPIYWILSTLLMVYLFYQYALVKLLFIGSMSFYAITQLMGYELDELIMGCGSLVSEMKRQQETKKLD